MAKAIARTRVYSYIRFSTPQQLKGNSLKRQLKLSQEWCERNEHVLDESFKLHDLGVSAFDGANAASGKLKAFIDAVDADEIKRGSILLVESLDRLTRQQISDALELFLGILRRGITIVTLNPEETFSKESVNAEIVKIIIAIIILSRAYEESNTKSKRISAARDDAREKARTKGRTLTRQVPHWVTVTEDGERVLDEAGAKVIQLIFNLKLKGMGTDSIARYLNENTSWRPQRQVKSKTEDGEIQIKQIEWNGWRGSYLKKILGNPAVIGEYQPHKGRGKNRKPSGDPIPDYYPKVVERKKFYAVQKRLRANEGKGGRNGKETNLFTHIVKCAYCGGPMHFDDKGKPPKGARYLYCGNGKRGVGPCAESKARRIRYDECEETILKNCERLKPDQVLPKPKAQADRIRTLRERRDGLEGELAQIAKEINVGVTRARLAKSDSIAEQYFAQLDDLDKRQKQRDDQLKKTRAELEELERTPQQFSKWKATLDTLRKSLNDIEVRRRLQAHLRELVEKVEVFTIGHKTQYDPDADEGPKGYETPSQRADRTQRRIGDQIWYVLDAIWDEAFPNKRATREFREFQRHVVARRLSKEGRFLRIHFRTGEFVDVVPKGSLASGESLEIMAGGRRRDWRSVSPEMQSLWEQFRAQQKKHRRTARRGKLATT